MDRTSRGLKADLHLHTSDGIREKSIGYDAFKLIDIAAEQGYELLSITNHDTVTYNSYLKDYARERGILLIPGVEITLKRKHILAYNLKAPLSSIRSFEDIERLKSRENLFMAPHPFFPGGRSLGNDLLRWQHLFDAIELSHFYLPSLDFNRRAVQVASSAKLPMVGTSDSHSLLQFGTTYTYIQADKQVDAVLEAVRSGRVEVVTEPLSPAGMAWILQDLLCINAMKGIGNACFALLSMLLRSS